MASFSYACNANPMKGTITMPSYLLSRPYPRPASRGGFTLIEIMIVVLVIGILLAIAVPGFVNTRETSRTKACVANLSQINSAKLQCMMDNKLSTTSAAVFSIDGVTVTAPGPNGTFQLTGVAGSPSYLRSQPFCPAGGTYTTGGVNTNPTCSTATDPSAGSNYQVGGRWFHGY